LLRLATRPTCAVHNNLCVYLGAVMLSLSFVVFAFRRKRAFAWRPAVDLSDPYVAAALAPMTHS
jgi:hypothetical protein